jgi:hypothetical protein
MNDFTIYIKENKLDFSELFKGELSKELFE